MTASRATGRATTLAVVALTLAAALLRLPSLGRSLWLDEAWRANIALAPTFAAFWNQVLGAGGGGIGAPMPPLFALAERAAGALVGHSAFGMRAFPVLASVAAVPLAHLVGTRAAGSLAGLGAALCFAASPTALLHGQELKQYSTDVLAVLVLLLVGGIAAARPSSAGAWIALAIAMSAAPGFSYPSALVLPGVALATLVSCRAGAERAHWLAAHVASGIAALAWYVLVIGPQRDRPLVTAYWAGEFPPLDGVPSVGWVGTQLLGFLGYCSLHPAWLAAVVVVAGLALASRWLGFAALATVATLVVAAAERAYPLSSGRTSVFLLPFVYLGVGAAVGGIAAVKRDVGSSGRAPARAIGRVLVAAAALVLALPMLARGIRAPAAGVVYEETLPLIAVLDAERAPADRVYVYDGAVQAFRFHHPLLDPGITLGGSHRQDQRAYGAELRPLLTPGQRVWLLFAHVHTPPGGRPERDTILADLSVYARQLDVREAEGASLHLFEVIRAPNAVKHLQLTPEDLANPERMKELLGR